MHLGVRHFRRNHVIPGKVNHPPSMRPADPEINAPAPEPDDGRRNPSGGTRVAEPGRRNPSDGTRVAEPGHRSPDDRIGEREPGEGTVTSDAAVPEAQASLRASSASSASNSSAGIGLLQK